DIPVVEIRSAWRAKRAGVAQKRLGVGADRLLEGITFDVRNLGPVKALGPKQSAGAGVGHHRVVELPVLVAYRRRLRSRVVEEHFACRFLRRAFEIGALVDAVESRLDDAGVTSGLDLLLESVTFQTAGDVDQRRQPIEG